MLVWLLVLLLLVGVLYISYRFCFLKKSSKLYKDDKQHYTFKL